jgi:hypothetical protein
VPFDPFQPVRLKVEYVSSASGSGKTLTAIAIALDRAQREAVKTIIAMPSLELVREMVEFAGRSEAVKDGAVRVVELTSRCDAELERRFTIVVLIRQHMTGIGHQGQNLRHHYSGPQLVFITHESLHRMGRNWPSEAHEWEIIIDEAPEVILTRQPFKLRDSFWVLTSFLDTYPAPVSPAQRRARESGKVVFTERDAKLLEAMQRFIDPRSNAALGEVEQARAQIERLRQKKADAGEHQTDSDPVAALPYLVVVAKPGDPTTMFAPERHRLIFQRVDDIYAYLDPLPAWLVEGAALFTDHNRWLQMTERIDVWNRGLITISGFRRPDALLAFSRVTMMSALFTDTMVYTLWDQLGVEFVASPLIRVSEPVTPLGKRKLRIYWLSAEGWSKNTRDRSGGIGPVLDLIAQSGAIDVEDPVCVCVNKDDGGEADPAQVQAHFPRAVMMPHNSRGQNRFRVYHQLIYTAALNSFTTDIRWIESVLGIDPHTQRIARTGQEIYQTMMRLSLREPSGTSDVSVVVMDKDVAEWLPQWFAPRDQVEVIEIDASGVIRRKGKPGRPRLGDKPQTSAERMRRLRARRQNASDENSSP